MLSSRLEGAEDTSPVPLGPCGFPWTFMSQESSGLWPAYLAPPCSRPLTKEERVTACQLGFSVLLLLFCACVVVVGSSLSRPGHRFPPLGLSARLLSALCSEPRSGESASLGVEGPQGCTRLTAGLAATVPSRLTQGAGLSLLATSGHPQGDGTLETDLEMCVHYASLTEPPLPC